MPSFMRNRTLQPTKTVTELLAEGVWYAEGQTQAVAEAVLRNPALFAELFEGLLSPDNGTCKRASMALEAVSERHPEWFIPYQEILLDELIQQPRWYVLYRLCTIVPRLRLNQAERECARARLGELLKSPRNVLSLGALTGLVRLALPPHSDDPDLREEMTWLVEQKMRGGSKAMQARGRHLLPLLHGAQSICKNGRRARSFTSLQDRLR
jgi:hypothetical protein